jgi:hypothetical protein
MTLQLRYWSLTFLLFAALGLFFERPAHAYTDPGSCLLLFQSIGAVASGALFYFRRRLQRLFSPSRAKEQASSPVAVPRVDS